MFAEGQDSGGGGDVRGGTTQNHPLMAEVKAVKEAEGKLAKIGASRGGGKRFG